MAFSGANRATADANLAGGLIRIGTGKSKFIKIAHNNNMLKSKPAVGTNLAP
jgi:hypothetical protein